MLSRWILIACLCTALPGALVAQPTKPAAPKGGPQTADKSQPMIVVETNYPGANAKVVADTIGAPIEQQVNGTPNLLHMASRCSNDGTYTLTVTFKPGADLDKARVQVQNRVALAQPVLPAVVKNSGITIRKKGPVRMIVSLTAPTGKHGTIFLSNYATIYVKDELTRIAGVGAVSILGQRDYSIRVWLDPQKLAALNLTAKEVADGIRAQNIQVSAGQIGEPPVPRGQSFQFKLETKGRLNSPEDVGAIIVKGAQAPGQKALVLKDVAKVELGAAANTDSYVSLNGKPSVILGVYPDGGASPKELSRAVANKIAKLGDRVPAGLRLEVAFDFTANLEAPAGAKTAEYLVLDLQMPVTASVDQMVKTLTRCDKLLREIAGVQDVLALTENPFDVIRNQPCLLVRLAPLDKRKTSREEIMRTIRTKLEKVPDAVLRVRDLSRLGGFPRCGYAIALAVSGPGDEGTDKLREVVEKFAKCLQESKKLTDVWANPETAPRTWLSLDVDRTKAAALGVAPQDVLATLEVYLGSMYVNDFNRFGRTWQVNIQADAKFRKGVEDFKQIQVRNKQGQMVPLAAVATVKTVCGPATIHQLDRTSIVEITANPAAGVSLVEARKLCETLFEQMRQESRLSTEYRLTWLKDIDESKKNSEKK